MKFRKKEVLKHFYEMGYDEESALEELDSLVYELQALKNPVKLYRIVQVYSKKDINLERPGSHYSKEKKSLIDNHCHTVGYGDKKFLITVLADKSLIDVEETLINNVLYPNENEVTLKNGGKGVEIVSVDTVCEDDYNLKHIVKRKLKEMVNESVELAPYIRRRYDGKKMEKIMKNGVVYAFHESNNLKEFLDVLFKNTISIFFSILHNDNIEEKVSKEEIEKLKEHLKNVYTGLATKMYHKYKKEINGA